MDCNQQPIKEALAYCYLSPSFPIEKMPLDLAGELMLFDQQYLTNDKGEFVFGGLYPSKCYTLCAEHDGCISSDKIVSINDGNDQILILKKNCIVEGRITSHDGKPLDSAVVTYCEPQSSSHYLIEMLGKEGRFRCDTVPEGFIYIQGRHEDYGHDLVKMSIRADTVNYVELKLPEGIQLNITVTDKQDNPVEGVRVSVRDQDSGAYLCSEITDETGKITAHSLNRGNRNLIYAKDLKDRYSVHDKTNTFTENNNLHIRLNKRFPVKLIVKDASTSEVISKYKACVCSYYKSSALLESHSLNTFTFEHEMNTPSFDFSIGKGECFDITVLADGYMPGRIITMLPAEGDISPFEVYLKPGIVLSGITLDADTLYPVPKAKIQLYVNGRYNKKPAFPLSIDRTEISNEDGTFSLSGLPKHRFYLRVEGPGYAPIVVDSLELDFDAPATENRIYLKQGGNLSGRIFTEDKLPLDQAYIQVKLTNSNELFTSRSNPDGSYCLNNLPTGKQIVSVWDVMDYVSSKNTMKIQKTVEILPGQTTTADFSFEDLCIIRGLCTIDGQEGCGIIIYLFDEKGVKTHSVDASSTGFYKISSITPGKYTIEAHSTVIGAGGMIRRPVSLQNGQDLTIDLDFKGKAVYGTVTDIQGQPLHAAEVELLTSSFQRNYLTYTNSEGNYAIFNVEEGEYYIGARAPLCGEVKKGPWMLGGTEKAGRKVDFDLGPGGSVRMHVVDNQGNPIPNAIVLLSNNMSHGILWSEKTKYSGIAVFDNLQSESLSALSIAKGYAAGGTTLLATANATTDAEITMNLGGSFNLTVKSKKGIPIPDAQVAFTDFSVLSLLPARLTQLGLLTPSTPGFLTDEKGVFSLGLLPPGNYKVQVTKRSRTTQVFVSITPGQVTSIQTILE